MGHLDNDGLIYLWSKIKALFNKGITNLSVDGKVITFTKGDGTTGTIQTQDTNTTYDVVSKSANGLAPKLPDETTTTKYLRQDGTWSVPPDNDTVYTHPTGSGNKHIPSGGSSGQILRWSADGTAAWGADKDTTYSVATASANGLMSSTDKGRVDNLYKRVAGYATTSGTAKAFTASIPGVTLTSGTMIALRFNYSNAPSATLNVNSLGAKPIYYKGAAISSGRAPQNAVMLLVYDTTQVTSGAWHLVYSYDSNTTYSTMTGATSSAAGFGGLVPSPAAGEQEKFLRGDGTWATPQDTTYDDFTGADETNAGTHGIVPAPAKGVAQRLLAADGTWVNWDGDVSADNVNPVCGAAVKASLSALEQGVTTANQLIESAQNNITSIQNNYAKKSDITNMYKYKGSVADASKLPTSGQTTGDVYNIEASSVYGGAGMNVAWNGSAWDPLGEIFTITAITNAEIDNICV